MLSIWFQGRYSLTRDCLLGAAACFSTAGAVQCLSAPLSPTPTCACQDISPTWPLAISQSGVHLPTPQFLAEWPLTPCSGLLGRAQLAPSDWHLWRSTCWGRKSWRFLGLFKALTEVSINNLQLDILHSPDPANCTIRQRPRAIVNDLHSNWDVCCCTKFCRLEAHSEGGLIPAAKPD